MNILYIYRGGLKHFKHFNRLYPEAQWGVYNPKKNRFIKKVDLSGKILVVDDEIKTTTTIYKVVQKLGLKDFIIGGDGEVKIDIPVGPIKTTGKIILFTGESGSGKSFFAYSLAHVLNIPYVKWGDYAKKYAGKYGEKLARIEKQNPFFLAQRIVKETESYKNFVLDNPKTEEQIIFVSYYLKKPVIPIFVETPEHLRKFIVSIRKDFDDVFDNERKQLFEKHFKKIREKSIILKTTDNEHPIVVDVIKRNFDISFRGFYKRNSLWYKPAMLEYLKKKSIQNNKLPIEEFDPLKKWNSHIHTSYLERFKIKDKRVKEIVVRTATAFRIIDDIFDEHSVREYKPTFHTQYSIFEGYIASMLLLYNVNALLTDDEKLLFNEMIERVYNAVKVELDLEISLREPTKDEYMLSLDREIAFREFVAKLIKLPQTEIEKIKEKAIKAQIKDDIFGAKKKGRENTEQILNRPCIYAKLMYKPSLLNL